MPYLGRSSNFAVRTVFTYTPSAGDTSVSGGDVDGKILHFIDGRYAEVYLNGVKLKLGTDYNTNTADTIAGLTALAANDEVEVVVYDSFNVSDTVSATTGGTFTGSVVFAGGFQGDAGNLTLKDTATADGSSPTLTLQTGDTDIAVDDVLGTIAFQAPDEGTGTDAILVAASIAAVSEGDFSSSNNATSLQFLTAASAAVGTGGGRMIFNSGANLLVKDLDTADGSSPTITLQTGDTDIAVNDVLGSINFQAPDEGTGTDAILVAAGIQAVSEGNFSSSNNATKLVFLTGASEAASSKMTLSSAGALAVAGVVTANAGVVVDNFTLDGTTLALSSGDMTIDVAGDLILDFAGDDLKFVSGGTQYGLLSKSSNNLLIRSTIADGDIVFQGNDDGDVVTALTLDMSSAGTAIFGGEAIFADSKNIYFGAGSDLQLKSDGTNGVVTAPNGTLTFDVAGDINLDAGGAEVFFKHGGTAIAKLHNSSGFILEALVSNASMRFRGNDGGSDITALTLDMADAGSAYFNNKVGVGTTSPTGFHNVNGNSAVNNIGYNLTWGGVGGGQSGVAFGMKIAAQTNNSSGDSYGLFSQAGQGTGGNTCGVYGDNNVASLTQNSGARSIGVWGQCIDNSAANGGSPYLANAQIKAGVLGLVKQIGTGSNATNAGVVANNFCTSGAVAYGVAIHTTAGPNAIRGLEYDHNGTVVLLIASTGNITNTNNSYGAISDLKLKENISAASSQWDDVKAIQVKKYSLKSDNLSSANQLGVIAQDLEASGMGGLVENDVMPITGEDGIVDPTQTETTKQVKYSVLYMKAVKALQEAMTRIESLETKVTALEDA